MRRVSVEPSPSSGPRARRAQSRDRSLVEQSPEVLIRFRIAAGPRPRDLRVGLIHIGDRRVSDAGLLAHLTETAQAVGKAQMAGFKPARIGLMLAGLEVPHCHFHVVPIRGVHDLDFGNQDPNPDPAAMDGAAATIRRELRRLRYSQVSD